MQEGLHIFAEKFNAHRMKASCRRSVLFLVFTLICCLLHNPALAQADTTRVTKSQPDTSSADPELIGGDYTEFVRHNLQYPTDAIDKYIDGTVILRLTVNSEGKLADIEVIQGVGGGCTEEAVRIAKMMDNWIPGRLKGVNVASRVTMRITFSLYHDRIYKRKHKHDKKEG